VEDDIYKYVDRGRERFQRERERERIEEAFSLSPFASEGYLKESGSLSRGKWDVLYLNTAATYKFTFQKLGYTITPRT
jgi:hypothetical protein